MGGNPLCQGTWFDRYYRCFLFVYPRIQVKGKVMYAISNAYLKSALARTLRKNGSLKG